MKIFVYLPRNLLTSSFHVGLTIRNGSILRWNLILTLSVSTTSIHCFGGEPCNVFCGADYSQWRIIYLNKKLWLYEQNASVMAKEVSSKEPKIDLENSIILSPVTFQPPFKPKNIYSLQDLYGPISTGCHRANLSSHHRTVGESSRSKSPRKYYCWISGNQVYHIIFISLDNQYL